MNLKIDLGFWYKYGNLKNKINNVRPSSVPRPVLVINNSVFCPSLMCLSQLGAANITFCGNQRCAWTFGLYETNGLISLLLVKVIELVLCLSLNFVNTCGFVCPCLREYLIKSL